MRKLSIKTPAELKIMAQGGRILGQIRDTLAKSSRSGVTTLELDALADKLITKAGGQASFKLVEGYHHATCISVNNEVVHGVPGNYIIKKGDVVSIDVGLVFKGYHTDTSVTVAVDSNNKEIKKFLEIGRKCLDQAIKQARVGKRIADISAEMQKVEEAGYSPVQALTGHGIGRNLHEEPAIPCFVVGEYHHSPLIKEGMVLAIEIMYNQGTADVVYKNNDGWTIATADGKISGLFEETVAVTKKGPVILTKSANG